MKIKNIMKTFLFVITFVICLILTFLVCLIFHPILKAVIPILFIIFIPYFFDIYKTKKWFIIMLLVLFTIVALSGIIMGFIASQSV
jgi:hypothetical protein